MSNPQVVAEEPTETKAVTVIINGTPKTVIERELSFEQVVELAFENPWSNPNTIYTVAYRRGDDKKPKGQLVKGQTVKVKDGMIFDVTPTDQS